MENDLRVCVMEFSNRINSLTLTIKLPTLLTAFQLHHVLLGYTATTVQQIFIVNSVMVSFLLST